MMGGGGGGGGERGREEEQKQTDWKRLYRQSEKSRERFESMLTQTDDHLHIYYVR